VSVSNAIGLMFSGLGIIMLILFPVKGYYAVFEVFTWVYLMLAYISIFDVENKNFSLWSSIYLFMVFMCGSLSILLK
jgi:hypothetical protein